MSSANGKKDREPFEVEGRSGPRRTHGFHALRAALQRVEELEGTEVGRVLADWREALVADLGGPEVLSTAQRALVEVCVRDYLLLSSIDAALPQADRTFKQGFRVPVRGVLVNGGEDGL